MRCPRVIRHLWNKKGYVLALTVVVMSIVTLLCTLLVSLVYLRNAVNRLENKKTEIEFSVDQIGEDYLISTHGGVAFDADNKNYGYDVSVSADGKTLMVKEGDTILLTVITDDQGDLVSWQK